MKIMKKTTILTVVLCCIAFTLLGCKAADTDNSISEENGLGNGMEIENGADETYPIGGDPALEENNPDITPEVPAPANKVSTEYEVQSLVSLNVRENPAANGKILGAVSLNATLPYIETVDSWYKVLYNDSIAYVSAKSSYTRLKPMASDADIIEKVIEEGLSVLGTPYEFGSIRIIDYNFNRISSFTGKTFDCSAFVQYAFYKGANIKLYGDSRTMSKQGVTVSYENIKRGDVIFMTSTARQYNTGIEKIGHVGIYLGDNKLLHTYGTGGVRITEFNSFWRGRFITAKNMF